MTTFAESYVTQMKTEQPCPEGCPCSRNIFIQMLESDHAALELKIDIVMRRRTNEYILHFDGFQVAYAHCAKSLIKLAEDWLIEVKHTHGHSENYDSCLAQVVEKPWGSAVIQCKGVTRDGHTIAHLLILFRR